MKQLGVLDAAFINLEHPNTPQQIGGLGIYDPSTAPNGFVRFKEVIASYEQRFLNYPMFRSRLVNVPGGIDRPYWVEDANFDPEFHIRHIALPAPGDWRQLCILVSRIHARPLDMTRPLWETYIIEGVDNIEGVPKGGFAIYTKMHHSLVDGSGGSAMMAAIHDLEPDPAPVPGGVRTIMVDGKPNRALLAANGALNQVKNVAKFAGGAANLVKDLGKLAVDVQQDKVPLPTINAPKTRFNTPVGPYRVFEACEFDFADVKAIKDAAGVKVNDVVMATVGGAMRKYLDLHGELPEESLAASIPLNMRTRRGITDDANQVGSVFMEVHSNIADPMERLRAVHGSANDAKSFGQASPLVDALKVAGLFAPALTKPVVNTYVNRELTRHMPANISTVVSNVAGPNFPVYSAGAQMVRYFGIGLLTPGLGLFHLAFTMNGLMTVGILADRDVMSDPQVYKQCFADAFEELKLAAQAEAAKAAKAAKSTKAEAKPAAKKAAVKKAAAKKAVAKKAAAPKKKIARKRSAASAAKPEVAKATV